MKKVMASDCRVSCQCVSHLNYFYFFFSFQVSFFMFLNSFRISVKFLSEWLVCIVIIESRYEKFDSFDVVILSIFFLV